MVGINKIKKLISYKREKYISLLISGYFKIEDRFRLLSLY